MLSDLPELIERCRAGDQRAWATLIDRYAGLVYAIARAHRLPEDACDDVAQVVFANLARSLDGLREAQALAAWVSTTTRRECWRLGRARARQRQVAQVLAQQGAGLEAEPPATVHLEDAHRVRLALEELGGRCQALLQALFGAGTADYQRLAEQLGMPVGSIGPTRQRCLAKLASILDQHGPHGTMERP
jgi:RNA polymerase sigma factor (sigma-70 family)